MIGYLRGTVRNVQQDHLLLDVSGVGYKIFATSTVLTTLAPSSALHEFYIETHVREDHIQLYGFLHPDEQTIFLLLTTVQGVGNKMALAILSSFPPAQIVTMILAADAASFTRVSGVGKRIGERIVTELKNKCPALVGGTVDGSVADTSANAVDTTTGSPPAAPSADAQDAGALSDAVQALEQLGYARSDAYRAAHSAAAGGASAVDTIITGALQQL